MANYISQQNIVTKTESKREQGGETEGSPMRPLRLGISNMVVSFLIKSVIEAENSSLLKQEE